MAPRTRVDDWAAITLGEGDTFAAALELMNRGGFQLALVLRADGPRPFARCKSRGPIALV